MALIFSELFEGVDGDDLIAYSPNWTRSSATTNGRVIITAGRARHNSVGTAAYYYRADVAPAAADYTVRGKFYFPVVPASGHSLGICARGATGSQSFYFLRALGGTGFVLARMVAGTASTLGTYAYTFTAGTEVVAELKVAGDQISAYLDGVLILGPFTDTTYAAAGVLGLRSINASTTIQLSEMSADDGVAAGGSTTTVSPAKASLSVEGFAPTIGRTANQSVSPAPATFSVRGYAPTITQSAGKTVSPAAAALAITGYAPMVSRTANQAVSPAAATLSVRGYAPVISQSGPRVVAPVPGALVLRGFAPTITQASSIIPRVCATTGMRASVTSRSAAMTAALNRGTVLPVSCAARTMLRQATLNRRADLGPATINRTGSFP